MRRVLLAAVAVTAFTGGAAVVGPAATTADARPAAACAKGTDDVTVVVDFGALGGGVQIRCAPWPVSSGAQALQKAGFTPQDAQRFPGLLCRIDGKPADDPCVVAPPADRYWAYWTAASPGGAWTYSATGYRNRQPAPGSVEGWAWSDGCTRRPQGAACATPTTQAPPTTARPTPTTRGGGDGSTGGGAGGTSGGGDVGSDRTDGSADGDAPSSTTTSDATGTDDEEGPTSTSRSSPTTADDGRAPDPGEDGDETAAAPGDTGRDGGGGSPVGALVGLGGAAALGTATLVGWRRRRPAEGG